VSARDEVLARIRRANAAAARDPAGQPAPEPAAGPVPPAYRCRGDRTAAELMDLLAGRLADYRASVVRATAAELPGAIAAALGRRGARRVVVPAGLSLPGVPNVAALAAIVPDVETVADDGLTAGQLDGFDGAVTAAAVAIAETGTIVLDAAAPDQGRRAISLVPDYHLCGPSATSDIELQRVEGVHGPRTLEVILVED
jgi:L-lactate dehydrogenase complex protein LldG